MPFPPYIKSLTSSMLGQSEEPIDPELLEPTAYPADPRLGPAVMPRTPSAADRQFYGAIKNRVKPRPQPGDPLERLRAGVAQDQATYDKFAARQKPSAFLAVPRGPDGMPMGGIPADLPIPPEKLSLQDRAYQQMTKPRFGGY